MRRGFITFASAAFVLLCAYGQVSRDAYRTAYRNWRQADPNLERDAGAGGPLLAERAEHLAEQARNYGVERSAFLQRLADDTQHGLAWLELPPGQAPPDVSKPASARVTAEIAAVKRTIDGYASDPDPGIQQVKMMLERENLTLAALNNAIVERQNMAEAAKAATAAAAIAQATALEKERELIAGLKKATGESDREKEAWAQYYRLVADAARGPVDAPVTPVTPPSNALVITPSSAAGPIIISPPVRTAPQVAAPPEPIATPPVTTPAPEPNPPPASEPTAEPTPPALKPSITPVPLFRYTGSWTLPQTKPQFYGPQPEVIDLTVSEDNGHAKGTLLARFKPPAGVTDPVVRFEFAGEFRNTRNQVFELKTSDGAKGRIELIPSTAINLLEINFLIEAAPGKIRQANVVLVKK